MGLAPYGEPRFKDLIFEKMIDLKEDGTFRLDQTYFDYCTGLRMTNDKFAEVFGAKTRKPEEELTQHHMDLAASVQAVTEEIVLRLARSVRKETGARNLCLAGGVALNCVANGKLLREKIFDNIWVQPAAGDAGGAVGAAYAAYHGFMGQPRKLNGHMDGMAGSYLGPEFTDDEIAARLTAAGARFTRLGHAEMIEQTAQALADEKAIGWMQGRMEFGPRALGNRSILASPRDPYSTENLNAFIKHRESVRKFAASVPAELASEYFDAGENARHLATVSRVRPAYKDKFRSAILAEDLIRVHTVSKEDNPLYWQLLHAFGEKTGLPVLYNTSFNLFGEPLVCTPRDAVRSFYSSGIDAMVVGNFLLEK
jgi:carbamoyltransferase